MKFISRIATVTAVTLLGLGIAHAQMSMPNPSAPGGSYESAIRLVSTSDLMLDRQIARWLRTHYKGWDAQPHEFQDMGDERYAIVYITHKEYTARRVYFRILRSQADPDNQSSDFPF